MRIAVDVDDVLYPFIPKLTQFHNETYGTNLREADFTTFLFWKVWGGTPEEASEKIRAFHQSVYSYEAPPIAGAVWALSHLSKAHDLVIVTGRQEEFRFSTVFWLKSRFPEIFSAFYFANYFGLTGRSYPKSRLCRIAEADLMIEDSLSHAEDCASNGFKVLLFGDYLWNQGLPISDKITRVANWHSIVKLLKP